MARTSTAPGRGGRTAAGIGALATIALIVALPFSLLWAAGNPAPVVGDWLATLVNDPTAALDRLWQAATSRDDGDLFLSVLALVGWAAAALAAWTWATFLLAVVTETVTQVRARRHGHVPRHIPRLPGTRFQRRAAAALVAAVIGALTAPALASATTLPARAAATAPAFASRPAVATQNAPSSQAWNADTHIAHAVRRGENLLDIAERHEVPWQRVAQANYGVTQPDGRALRTGSTRVYAGWTLRIPVAAAPAAAPSSTVYTVARGDWLSGVARRFLGDTNRYPDIAALNPRLELRDHRFPDHIEPGWQIVLPPDARDRGVCDHARGVVSTAPPHAAPRPPTDGSTPRRPNGTPPTPSSVPSAPAGPAEPAVPAETPGSGRSPAPTASPDPPRSPAPGATRAPGVAPATPGEPAPGTPAPTRPTPQLTDAAASPDNPEPGSRDDTVVIGSLAGAGLLSALLVSAVMRHRRRQRQHRRPGRRLPHPRGGAIERALRVAEQPADVDRLDAALRGLAATLTDRPGPLPDIAAAWIVDQAVTVLLATPCPNPPPPWTGDSTQWTLPGDVPLPDADDQLAPLPALVTIGSQPGRHLLLELERLGSLTITGDSDHAAALLRYLASELACNTWSDDVEVIVAGFPPPEAKLLVALNPNRVRIAASVADVAARLGRRVADVATALDSCDVADTLAGRVTAGDEAWAPQVLLVAAASPEDQAVLDALAAELHDAGRHAVVVVACRSGADGDGHAISVDEDGVLHVALPFLHADVAAAGLPVRELEPLARIMSRARAIADEPTPPAEETESWADGTDSAGSVLALLTNGDPVDAACPPDADLSEAMARRDAGRPGADVADPAAREDTATSPVVEVDLSALSVGPEPITAVPRIDSVPAVLTTPRRGITVAIGRTRRQTDPNLDADVRAWHERDQTIPRIGILGPVTIEAPGPAPDLRRRFHAEIIVYLAQRGARGVSGEQLSDALWPDHHVKDASRRVAITRARRWLGDTRDGTPWLPEMGPERIYRLQPGYLLDWHLFRRLRSRAESHGEDGAEDLRAALELVRGAPLDGADRAYAAGARNPFTWLPESDIYPGHITSAIVDVAHQLAELYLEEGDTAGVRWSVQCAWLADPYRGDDEPWQDLMRAECRDGHHAELRNLLAELMRARDAEIPEDLTPQTYALLRPLLPELLGASSPS